jgi:hypothetical protein
VAASDVQGARASAAVVDSVEDVQLRQPADVSASLCWGLGHQLAVFLWQMFGAVLDVVVLHDKLIGLRPARGEKGL